MTSATACFNGLRRATRQTPCPICKRTKYCSFSESIVICMTEEAGSTRPARNGGFIHCLDGDEPTRRYRSGTRSIYISSNSPARGDLTVLCAKYQSAAMPFAIESLADRLGVSADSLVRVGIGWMFDGVNRRGPRTEVFDAGDVMRSCAVRAWSFPMRDASGNIVGIKIRTDTGEKFAVAGSRNGLTIPAGIDASGRLLITEGPTDTAALLDLGFAVIGRSSCTGETRLLTDYIAVHRPASVVIVADGDAPGERGAESLATVLQLYVPRLKIITPPPGIKDARAWKLVGANAADILAAIDSAQQRKPVIRRSRLEVSHV